jgi:hypothetical protein
LGNYLGTGIAIAGGRILLGANDESAGGIATLYAVGLPAGPP